MFDSRVTPRQGIRLSIAAMFGALALTGIPSPPSDVRPTSSTSESIAEARTSPLAGPAYVVNVPTNAASKNAIMLLHGMCGTPENIAAWFAGPASSHGWLLSPRGNVECSEDTVMWGTSTEAKLSRVDAAFSALEEKLGSTPVDNTLIGFSQGAYTAVEIAAKHPGRYTSMLLIGASITPAIKSMKDAGIRRIVFAAGDLDQSKDAMEANARRLGKEGIETKFMSLGKIGHAFPEDMQPRMAEALRWLRR